MKHVLGDPSANFQTTGGAVTTVDPASMNANNLSAKKNKKIEEDYTMFEEVKDDELEDIIEEELEEESEDEKNEGNDDLMATSHEEREERRREREDLKTLKT